jgi:DNA topoisomerase-1
LNRAVTVLAEKQSKGPGGRGRTAAALKEMGEHPDGGAITVRDGKYGPYINWAKVNATLPKGKDPQSVTIEEALLLIAEKAGKRGTKKTAAKKAPAKAAAKPKAVKTKAADATAAKPKKTTAAKPKATAAPKTKKS